jgi:hypothetical protein
MSPRVLLRMLILTASLSLVTDGRKDHEEVSYRILLRYDFCLCIKQDQLHLDILDGC